MNIARVTVLCQSAEKYSIRSTSENDAYASNPVSPAMMTKGAVTLLWMAPEISRGSSRYAPEGDVHVTCAAIFPFCIFKSMRTSNTILHSSPG